MNMIKAAPRRSRPAGQVQPTDSAVTVRDLTRRFGATEALRGISFEVAPGEVFGLLGPNGAGKTTAIRILLTLLRPTSGSAQVAGLDVVAHSDAVRRTVGWVPQERTVDPLLSARENLGLAAGLYHLSKRAATHRTGELLELVALTEHADRLVKDFSGGMRRRLELAMGLVHRPTVLVLDEPTLGLDIAARRSLWDYVGRLRASGTTVLVTTHYLDEAGSVCDRIAIIDAGSIKAIGRPVELTRSFGRTSLHAELAAESGCGGLVSRLEGHEGVRTVGIDGRRVDIEVDDIVSVTSTVLDHCERTQTGLLDLWARRANLDDVFMALAGHELDTMAVPDETPERVDQA